MTSPQNPSLKGLTAKGNDWGIDGTIRDGGGSAGSGSRGRSPRRLLFGGSGAWPGNECRGCNYDSYENQGNQEVSHSISPYTALCTCLKGCADMNDGADWEGFLYHFYWGSITNSAIGVLPMSGAGVWGGGNDVPSFPVSPVPKCEGPPAPERGPVRGDPGPGAPGTLLNG